MSLKDLASNIGTMVSPPQIDDTAARGPVLSAIERAERQWASADVDERPDWFSHDGGHVAFAPKLANGAPLTIDGQTTVFVPADRFAAYLANMRRAVEDGVFDAEIRAGLYGSASVSGLAQVPMPDRAEAQGEQADGHHAGQPSDIPQAADRHPGDERPHIDCS